MCGRFYLDMDDPELTKLFSSIKEKPDSHSSGYKTGEIFPTNRVPIITPQGITIAKWGFPKWDKKGVIINARSESLRQRDIFKDLVDKKRCIIPASAYFEWKKTSEDGEKGKYIIGKEKSILYMAGLFNTFTEKAEQLSLLDEANGTDYLAFTIITKEANNYLAKIHHRMPLIIDSNQVEDWLKGEDLSLFKSKEEQNMLYKLYAN